MRIGLLNKELKALSESSRARLGIIVVTILFESFSSYSVRAGNGSRSLLFGKPSSWLCPPHKRQHFVCSNHQRPPRGLVDCSHLSLYETNVESSTIGMQQASETIDQPDNLPKHIFIRQQSVRILATIASNEDTRCLSTKYKNKRIEKIVHNKGGGKV